MTKKSRPKNGSPTHTEVSKFIAGVSHEIMKELRRLNSARMGQNELSRLARGERARAVKDALAAHHQGVSRCC
jgi:hypothetical protein